MLLVSLTVLIWSSSSVEVQGRQPLTPSRHFWSSVSHHETPPPPSALCYRGGAAAETSSKSDDSSKLVAGVLELSSSPTGADDNEGQTLSLSSSLSDIFLSQSLQGQEQSSSLSSRITISNPSILFLNHAQRQPSSSVSAFIDGLQCTSSSGEDDSSSQSSSVAARTQAMGMLCDVLVLYLPDISIGNNGHGKDIVAQLKQGLQQRWRTGILSSKVIVVSPSFVDSQAEIDSPESRKNYRKELIATTVLAELGARELDELELVAPSEWKNQWRELVDVRGASEQETATTMTSLIESDNENLFLSIFEKVLASLGAPLSKPLSVQSVDDGATSFDGSESTRSSTRTTSVDRADEEIIPMVIEEARNKLELLEQKIQDIWLAKDDGGKQQIPLLDFGNLADDILNQAHDSLTSTTTNHAMNNAVLDQILSQIKTLYHQQLDALRDYYGRRYEKVLQELPNDEQAWAESAGHMTEGFRAAAQHAIPKLCQPGDKLCDADFEYAGVLQGLLSDMMEATTQRQDEEAVAVQLAEHDSDDVAKKEKVPRWLKKLGARGLMLGVNYLQGWLAWQGIKRAAVQRDRDMPKFPLY